MNIGTVRNMPELTFIGDSFFFFIERNRLKQLNMHGENIRWPFSLILNTVLLGDIDFIVSFKFRFAYFLIFDYDNVASFGMRSKRDLFRYLSLSLFLIERCRAKNGHNSIELHIMKAKFGELD